MRYEQKALLNERVTQAFETPQLISLKRSDVVVISQNIATNKAELTSAIAARPPDWLDPSCPQYPITKLESTVSKLLKKTSSKPTEQSQQKEESITLKTSLQRVEKVQTGYTERASGAGFDYRLYPTFGLVKQMTNEIDDAFGSPEKSGMEVFSSILLWKGDTPVQNHSEDSIILPPAAQESAKLVRCLQESDVPDGQTIARTIWPELMQHPKERRDKITRLIDETNTLIAPAGLTIEKILNWVGDLQFCKIFHKINFHP